MMKLDELLSICGKHTRVDQDPVVIREAYVPHIPENWNGLLVLAESQNLSVGNDGYVAWLKTLDSRGRMIRLLDTPDDGVGVGPWDDGALKLAVEAAFKVKADETGVSNAVCWSRRGDGGESANPTPEMVDWAVDFWLEILPAIQPARIVAAGRVAHTVIERADPGGQYPCTRLRLPSPQAMSRISGMFRRDDLLTRYHEVRQVVERHEDWGKSLNNIFYACHATSSVAR